MSSQSVWDAARVLIKEGELAKAIDLVECWLKGRFDTPEKDLIKKWLAELIVHYSQIRSTQQQSRKGLITRESERVEVNQISYNILSLVDIIERENSKAGDAGLPDEMKSAPVDDGFEKIIGDRSHLQMVNWLEKGINCSTAVCRLISSFRRGSGFRTEGNLIITNNHVIKTPKEAEKFVAQFFFEERIDNSMKDVIDIKLDASRFWTSVPLDVTVVGADFSSLPAGTGVVALPLKPDLAADIGDSVSIIQHPLGGPKQIALTSNQIVNLFEHRLQYVTDTLPGSSGAPVFNDMWEVIAVHHAGGNLVKDSKGSKIFANEGIMVQAFASNPEISKLMT